MDKSIEELIDQLNLIRARKVQREMERGKIKVDEIRSDYGVPGMKWKNHFGVNANTGMQSRNISKKMLAKPMPQPRKMTKGALTAISKGVASPRSRMTGGANYSRTGMTNSLRSGNAATKYANGRAVASANMMPKMRRAAAKLQVKTAGNPKDSNGGDTGVKYNSNGTVSGNENVSWLDKELGIGKNGMAKVIDNMKSQNEKNETEQPSE